VDPIFENASNKYKLGLAVLQVWETGTKQTFGDRAVFDNDHIHG